MIRHQIGNFFSTKQKLANFSTSTGPSISQQPDSKNEELDEIIDYKPPIPPRPKHLFLNLNTSLQAENEITDASIDLSSINLKENQSSAIDDLDVLSVGSAYTAKDTDSDDLSERSQPNKQTNADHQKQLKRSGMQVIPDRFDLDSEDDASSDNDSVEYVKFPQEQQKHYNVSVLPMFQLNWGAGSAASGTIGGREYWSERELEKGVIYSGTLEQHFLPDGLGNERDNSGNGYVGEYNKGKKHGYGCDYRQETEFYGKWLQGKPETGWGKFVLAKFVKSTNVEVNYEGTIMAGKYHGLGCLTIETNGKYFKTIKVKGIWEDNKLIEIPAQFNEFIMAGKKYSDKLIKTLDGTNPNDGAELNRSDLYQITEFSTKHSQITNLYEFRNEMSKKGEFAKLSEDTKATIDGLIELRAIFDYAAPYFKFRQQNVIGISLDTIKAIITDNAVKYRYELKNCAYINGSKLSAIDDLPVFDIIFTLDHLQDRIILVYKPYVKLFAQLNAIACNCCRIFPPDESRKFVRTMRKSVGSLWTGYSDTLGIGKINNEVNNNIESYKYLFLLMQDTTECLMKAKSDSVENAFNELQKILTIVISHFKPWQENQDVYQIANITNMEEEHITDRQMVARSHNKQLWNHLIYHVFKNAFKDTASALQGLYREYVANANRKAEIDQLMPYEQWREAAINVLHLQSVATEKNGFFPEKIMYIKAASQRDEMCFPRLLRKYYEYEESKAQFTHFIANNVILKQFVHEIETIINAIIELEKQIYNSNLTVDLHVNALNILADFMVEFSNLDLTLYVNKGDRLIKINDELSIAGLKAEGKVTHLVLQDNIELLNIVAVCPPFVSLEQHITAKYKLLEVISKSFRFLRKQEVGGATLLSGFHEKYLLPYRKMLKNADELTFEEYLQKLSNINGYFTHTVLHKEISLNNAIDMFRGISGNKISEEAALNLIEAYETYSEHYNTILEDVVSKSGSELGKLIGELKFMATKEPDDSDATVNISVPNETNVAGAATIAVKRKRDILKERYKKFTKDVRQGFNMMLGRQHKDLSLLKGWSSEQRNIILPQIIARLAVILSLLESGYKFNDTGEKAKLIVDKHNELKDSEDKEFLLKPNCIQILGLFRLLGVDKEWDDLQHHLSEILTGQGKSWVLAILATCMALTGHNVTIVCYNEDLTKRDRLAFQKFFNLLDLGNLVEYCTFKEMAEGSIRRTVKLNNIVRESWGTREFAKAVLDANHEIKMALDGRKNTFETKVILIDEVDVFFADCYGRVNGMCHNYFMNGLNNAQEFIWKQVKEGNGQVDVDRLCLQAKNSIVSEDNLLVNSQLMSRHLKEMVEAAIRIYKEPDMLKHFKIDPDDECVMYYDSELLKFRRNTLWGYNNSFAYMGLRDRESFSIYNHKNGGNFGYLNISCGRISYALIPKAYPLILGVSGTLQNLNESEANVISADTQYAIKRWSYFPSFFGPSKCKFDATNAAHFTIYEQKDHWQNAIVVATQKLIKNGQAALIFLSDEYELNDVKDRMMREPFRLFILDPYATDEQKKNVIDEESGRPGAVTLLTKNYGRGTDFKSSPGVNRNGGVGVIQAFPSVDTKEQIQIKGRTARQDNPGMFYLFMHDTQLKQANITTKAGNSYNDFDKSRKERYAAVHKAKTEQLQRANIAHEQTYNFINDLAAHVGEGAYNDPDKRGQMLNKILTMKEI